ncbi:MAG: hypothetical protein LAT52_05620 [Balneolales bacterium]|nr:hypothetical protein [Balneolales bacterium]
MKHWVAVLLILVISAGCDLNNRAPLDEETYMQIRTELEIVYMIHSYTGDTERTAEILQYLKDYYNFTLEEFMASYRFYERQLPEEIARYERMIMAMNEERLRIDDVARDVVTDVELELPEDRENLRHHRAIGEEEEEILD